MNREQIPGGFILLSRKLLKNGIMEKPPLYLKLWVWMLMQASFKDHGNLKRGQFFTSYRKMRKAMAYKIGYRTSKPTKREAEGVTKFLAKVRAIVTTKVLHGMVITILNYDYYQNMKNYEGYNERPNDGINDVPIKRKKGIKKEKPLENDFSLLRERYTDQALINRALDAIASTRKLGKVKDTVLLAQLKKWEKYSVAQVETGIRIYLEKDYAGNGKNENYLYGIIRNSKAVQNEPISKPPKILTPEEIEAMHNAN